MILKLFGNSWGNSYIPCLLLIITLPVTCGESKILPNINKFQNITAMMAGFANNTCVKEVQSFDFISVYQDDLYCLTDQKVSVKADSKLSRQNQNSKKLLTVKKSNSRNKFLNHDIFLISVELRTMYQKVTRNFFFQTTKTHG